MSTSELATVIPEDLVVFVSSRFESGRSSQGAGLVTLLRRLGAQVMEGDIAAGGRIDEGVRARLAVADVVVCLMPPEIAARPWLLQEAYFTQAAGKPVIYLLPCRAWADSALVHGLSGPLLALVYGDAAGGPAACPLVSPGGGDPRHPARGSSENPQAPDAGAQGTSAVDPVLKPLLDEIEYQARTAKELDAAAYLSRLEGEAATSQESEVLAAQTGRRLAKEVVRDLVLALRTHAVERAPALAQVLPDRAGWVDVGDAAAALALVLAGLLAVVSLGVGIVDADPADPFTSAMRTLSHVMNLGLLAPATWGAWRITRRLIEDSHDDHLDGLAQEDQALTNFALRASHPARQALTAVVASVFGALFCATLAYATQEATNAVKVLSPTCVADESSKTLASCCECCQVGEATRAEQESGGRSGGLSSTQRGLGVADRGSDSSGETCCFAGWLGESVTRCPAGTHKLGNGPECGGPRYRSDLHTWPDFAYMLLLTWAGACALNAARVLRTPASMGPGWGRLGGYMVMGGLMALTRLFLDNPDGRPDVHVSETLAWTLLWQLPDWFNFVCWGMLAARLAGRNLNLSPTTYIPVFLYAALQPLSAVIGVSPYKPLYSLLFLVAFGLRTVILFGLYRAFTSGTMLWAIHLAIEGERAAAPRFDAWLRGLRALRSERERARVRESTDDARASRG